METNRHARADGLRHVTDALGRRTPTFTRRTVSEMSSRVLAVDGAEQVIGAAYFPDDEVLHLARLGLGRSCVLRWIGGGETRMPGWMTIGLVEDMDALDVPPAHRAMFEEVRALAELVLSDRAVSLRFVID
jgi:hypothetical protein